MEIRNTTYSKITSGHKLRSQHEAAKRSSDNKVKIAALTGSAVGILSAMTVIGLKAKKDPANAAKSLRKIMSNFDYKEKDLLKLGAGSIIGGLAGGLATDKNSNKKSKLREAIQQFFGNIAAPVGLVTLNTKLLEKSKFKMPLVKETRKFAPAINNVLKNLPKIAVITGSLFLGIELGNKVVNKINDKLFKKVEKHEIEASDYTAHMDDLCLAGNLLFKESPALTSVLSKILPATFLVAGYKTGVHSPEINTHKH